RCGALLSADRRARAHRHPGAAPRRRAATAQPLGRGPEGRRLAYLGCGCRGAFRPDRHNCAAGVSILVLMYHGVERRSGPLFVEPGLFAEHVAVIAESGLPVLTVGEVGALLRDGRLPARAVALTFDDGFASVVEHAAPLLHERGLRATVFCVTGHLG